jgi:hypothetical protein
VCKKNELWALIKKVSNHNGGDDEGELKAFAKNLAENYTIDEGLTCFRDLAKQCETVKIIQKTTENDTKKDGYQLQPPFFRDES